jgi:hypothetical protein
MIAAAHAAPLFFTQFKFWEGVSALGLAWLGSYFKWFRPMLKEKQAIEAQKQRETAAIHGFVFGDPGDGVRPEVIAAPIQMKVLTDAVDEAKASNVEVARGQALLEQRMQEQNGSIASIKRTVESIAGRPPVSVAEVKAAMAVDHAGIEERQQQLLDAIKESGSS